MDLLKTINEMDHEGHISMMYKFQMNLSHHNTILKLTNNLIFMIMSSQCGSESDKQYNCNTLLRLCTEHRYIRLVKFVFFSYDPLYTSCSESNLVVNSQKNILLWGASLKNNGILYCSICDHFVSSEHPLESHVIRYKNDEDYSDCPVAISRVRYRYNHPVPSNIIPFNETINIFIKNKNNVNSVLFSKINVIADVPNSMSVSTLTKLFKDDPNCTRDHRGYNTERIVYNIDLLIFFHRANIFPDPILTDEARQEVYDNIFELRDYRNKIISTDHFYNGDKRDRIKSKCIEKWTNQKNKIKCLKARAIIEWWETNNSNTLETSNSSYNFSRIFYKHQELKGC
ncbi:MAG: hypothetical protein JKX76_02215 [Colwellia sp.]|nr:hypothetical protein [Colwellia sp.]